MNILPSYIPINGMMLMIIGRYQRIKAQLYLFLLIPSSGPSLLGLWGHNVHGS